ncbi:MAG TPA: hypothetical protein VLG50_05555 [Candidatus Saccharimonadales bacterium]|nr:hypothetical protein [Candidatus Saccharimonadales bacterium]
MLLTRRKMNYKLPKLYCTKLTPLDNKFLSMSIDEKLSSLSLRIDILLLEVKEQKEPKVKPKVETNDINLIPGIMVLISIVITFLIIDIKTWN